MVIVQARYYLFDYWLTNIALFTIRFIVIYNYVCICKEHVKLNDLYNLQNITVL